MPRPGDEGRETERVYDRLSHVYDLLFGAVCFPGRKKAIDRLGCRPGDRVLEIGFGTGSSGRLYPEGVRVVGVDISRQMLRRAASRTDGKGARPLGLARMDAHRLGFEAESFDKVAAFYVISVLPDPIRAVQEMKRVCRPGGDLIILNHFHSSRPIVRKMEKALDPLTSRIGWRTTLELEGLIRSTSLDVVGIETVNLFRYWDLVHARKGRDAIGAAAGIA